jgi:hypothetical protein
MTPICSFFYSGPTAELERRQLLGLPLAEFHNSAIKKFQGADSPAKSEWQVSLGKSLLFNEPALRLIERSLRNYQGKASELELSLKLDESTYRHFYSLQSELSPHENSYFANRN